jgi:hypothetical protein
MWYPCGILIGADQKPDYGLITPVWLDFEVICLLIHQRVEIAYD